MEKIRALKTSWTIFFLLLLVCISSLYYFSMARTAKKTAIAANVPTSATHAITRPNACGKWTIVNSPSPSGTFNTLNSVTALSVTAAWAVGSSASTQTLALVEHWNGTSWSTVGTPHPGSQLNTLQGSSAVSPADVWAVGWYANSNSSQQTLIEHWNGTVWSVVASPNPNTENTQLMSVVAISSTNVWAVGNYTGNSGQQTLVEHWNGSAWSIVSSPNPTSSATSSQLNGVAAISANNIWATGFSYNISGEKTLLEHWNGSTWSIVSSPNTHLYGNLLGAITAISAKNIWAVGYSFNQSGSAVQTLVEHWNGSTWSIVASPNPIGSVDTQFRGVAATSASDIWAVGQQDTGHQSFQVLIEHWNGTQWSITASPNPGPIPNLLQAVTRVPGTNRLWAVGYHVNRSNAFVPLIESYC